MNFLAVIVCRYAPTVRLAELTLALENELDLRAWCASGGARSPNQRPPGEILEWLLWAIGLYAFLWIAFHSRH